MQLSQYVRTGHIRAGVGKKNSNFNLAHTTGCELLRSMNQIQASTIADFFFYSLSCCGAYSILSVHEKRLHSPQTSHAHAFSKCTMTQGPCFFRTLSPHDKQIECHFDVDSAREQICICLSCQRWLTSTHPLCRTARGVSSGTDAAVLLVLCQTALLCWLAIITPAHVKA